MKTSARPAGTGKARPSRKVTPASVETPSGSSHRSWDIAGVLMFAFALIVQISLFTSNSGFLGHAFSGAFSLLFGRGAWIVPPLAILLGITFLKGRGPTLTHLAWGLTLIFLTALGFLAQDSGTGYFTHDICVATGGYLGAVLGYLFQIMLGVGKAVGLVTMGLVGLVLCVDVPIRTMLAKTRDHAVTLKEKTLDRPKRVRPSSSQTPEERVRPIKKALEEAISRERTGPDTAVIPETVQPKVTKESKSAPRSIVMEDPDPEPDLFADIEEAPKKTKAHKGSGTIVGEEPTLLADAATPKEGYQLPPLNLLSEALLNPKRSQAEMQKNIETLEGTLEQFGIEATVVEVANGPTVTRYEIQLGPGVRVARITALAENIAMDLAASQVRVEAPIPGKAAIGVEVPNESPSVVTLRELCDDPVFQNHPSRLYVALGKDVSGTNKYLDLTKMPHLLVGGATNSGKSIGLATLITSLIMRNTPKDLRLVMIDPKRVELTLFDHIPHLMCPVVKDTKEAAGVLRAVWREMDRRYDLFSNEGVRNIDSWNSKASFQDKLPYIVIIIDELADLMIQHRAEVETVIVRLAQLARAVGIHMVLATQRPSVDVITGLIKANIPSRIAFSVASHIDSRTILDQKGAEALIGKGDMLYSPIDANKPVRIQGCYVSEREIDAVCKFWREQEKPAYVLQPIDETVVDAKKEGGDFDEEMDPFWEEAVRWVAERGQASTSMLQRKFSIGFQRASRLLDLMEERSIVGPRDGPRPREVLVSYLEIDELFGGTGSSHVIREEDDAFTDDV
jgi:DNA segregation ATPase FtsK/SpoIIIE, S-DNA-T family